MSKFAKVYESAMYGQMLVLLDVDDDGEPCVKFMGKPPGLNVCVVAISFSDEQDAQECFDNVAEEQVASAVASLWKFSPEVEMAS